MNDRAGSVKSNLEENDTARWEQSGRVPILDGLRAVSIGLVLLSHMAPSIGSTRLTKVLSAIGAGHLGVTCFLVISGFLITLLMLRETQRNGAISLKLFYARRVLRLLPAYLVYLLAIFLLTRVSSVQIAPTRWAAALTYTMCFMPNLNSAWHVGHLWSLSVEEHFYFLWPILLYVLRPRRAVIVAAGYVVLSPVLRYAIWAWFGRSIDIDFASPSQMSSIAVGCVAAYLAFHFGTELRLRLSSKQARAGAVLAMITLCFSIAMTRLSGKYCILFSDPVNSISIAVLMLSLLYRGEGLLYRALESRPMVMVGVLSYSLYLWQQPFTFVGGGALARWPVNLVCIFVTAMASYWLVERPFMGIRERLRKGAGAQLNARIIGDAGVSRFEPRKKAA